MTNAQYTNLGLGASDLLDPGETDQSQEGVFGKHSLGAEVLPRMPRKGQAWGYGDYAGLRQTVAKDAAGMSIAEVSSRPRISAVCFACGRMFRAKYSAT